MELVAEVTFADMVDAGDFWDIEAADAEVTRVSFDWSVTLLVSSGNLSMEVRIENTLLITAPDGSTVSVDPEVDSAQLAGALGLLRAHIGSMRAVKSGSLEIRFDDGHVLSVPPDADFEAWGIAGTHGVLVVSSPGGELAIWQSPNHTP